MNDETLAPILRLSADVWSCVSDLLDYESVLNLLSVGNDQVSSAVERNVRHIWCQYAGPVFDFEGLLRSSHRFGALLQLHIDDEPGWKAAKKPVAPLVFPPTLTSLLLNAVAIFDLISHVDLASQAPKLRTLKLVGTGSDQLKLEDLSIPSELETLVLRPWSLNQSVKPEWISSLPRSLTYLKLYAMWEPTRRDTDGSIQTDFWPPSLATLKLDCPYTGLIEHLPRTLTTLRFQPAGIMTKYPRKDKFVFPWRSFFPYLHTLQISHVDSDDFDLKRLLRTILVHDALEVSEVDTFIASGFWDVPSLRRPSGGAGDPYPSFQLLTLPADVTAAIGSDITELTALSPYLANTNFDDFGSTHSAIALLKSTKSVRLESEDGVSSSSNFELPPSVTNLFAHSAHLSMLTPNVLVLDTYKLEGSEEVNMHEGDFPPKLLTLSTYTSLPLYAVRHLPSSITKLDLPIGNRSDWDIIASRLCNLKDLQVRLQDSWLERVLPGDSPLSSIESQRLERASIHAYFDSYPKNRPKLSEFFSTPIFPPSLKDLSIFGDGWHVSLLALLPKSLGILIIDAIEWELGNDSKFAPYPEAAGMSHEDLIKCLPPKLSSLTTFGTPKNGEEDEEDDKVPSKPDFQILRFLPRTIVSLSLQDIFDMTDCDITILPPYFCEGYVKGLDSAEVFKRLRPHGFWN